MRMIANILCIDSEKKYCSVTNDNLQFCIKSSGRRSLPNNDINTDLGDITKLSLINDSGSNSSGDSADDVIARSSSDVKVCDSCCSGDLCNNAGCGATG